MDRTHNKTGSDATEGRESAKPVHLLQCPEGRLLIIGVGLALLYFVGLGVSFFWWPENAHVFFAMTVSNVAFGRAAGMSVGYAAGLAHGVVVPVNMLIETILVLLCYPLFVLSWREWVEVRLLRKFMRRTRQAAEAHQHTIERYGFVGLFVFVWLPFWMTGPVVGSVIGFFLGLRPWVNVTVVLGGTYLAIAVWAMLLQELHDRLVAHTAYGPVILVFAVLAVLAVRRAVKRRQERKHAVDETTR